MYVKLILQSKYTDVSSKLGIKEFSLEQAFNIIICEYNDAYHIGGLDGILKRRSLMSYEFEEFYTDIVLNILEKEAKGEITRSDFLNMIKDLKVLRFIIMYLRITIEAYLILKMSLKFISSYIFIVTLVLLIGYLINKTIFTIFL